MKTMKKGAAKAAPMGEYNIFIYTGDKT